MEANLQAYEKDMIRELRQAGVLVSRHAIRCRRAWIPLPGSWDSFIYDVRYLSEGLVLRGKID